jgi:radical SAM superfamily enzyme YgiQ (UPF0313 family)
MDDQRPRPAVAAWKRRGPCPAPRIVLINPDVPDGRGFLAYNEGRFKRLLVNPSMTMPYIAALTPPSAEVSVCDETLGDTIDYDADVDLVGMTLVTQVARRAYEIADRFMERGVAVVLGGSHPTLLPEEAGAHAAAVVVGEAEDAWPRLVEDFRRGELQPYYNRTGYHSLENLPAPRWDLLTRRYKYLGTQLGQVKLSRGCPHRCSTCSIVPLYGGRIRYRPLRDVLREVEACDEKVIYFCEDNIAGNHAYAKKLFTEMIPLKKNWVSISTTTLAMDEELLSLAAESGCKGIYFGIETLSVEGLREMRKYHNTGKDLVGLVRRTQRMGIVVTGGFLVGFDTDTPVVFQQIVDFIEEARLDVVQFYVIVPFPRTEFYETLKRENRLLSPQWWLDDFYSQQVLYRPARLSAEELRDGFMFMTSRTYSLRNMGKRVLGDFRARGLSPLQLISSAGLNLGYREVYREQERLYREKSLPSGDRLVGESASVGAAERAG